MTSTQPTYPLVDCTGLSSGTYYVGGPNGRDGSYTTFLSGARLYSTSQDGDGAWHVRACGGAESVEEDTAIVLAYLTGARHVQVTIWRDGGTSDVEEITEHVSAVADGPHPHDRSAWCTWVRNYAAAWLSAHGHGPGRYQTVASDTGAARCADYLGLLTLGAFTLDLAAAGGTGTGLAEAHPADRSPERPHLPVPVPRCDRHGPMRLRPGRTAEQRWCGTWYDCPAHHCGTTLLLSSPALLSSLDAQRQQAAPSSVS